MRLAVVVSFLNESRFLPELLPSLAAQTRFPDELLLVDDGSTDDSFEQADAFARAHPNTRALRRPRRAEETDRLATAAELKSFLWAVEHLGKHDVLVKLDADLRLQSGHIETVLETFSRDPRLGVCGAMLSVVGGDGQLMREQHPREHVRGPNKFYRRECFADISPLPPILGWDTIDEISARMSGWHAYSVLLPDGDSVHLRPTGLHDGRLRAMRRWGECAWGYGATPLTILAGAVRRGRRRPFVLSGLNYAFGYLKAARDGKPRSRSEIRAFARREQRARFRKLVAPGAGGRRPEDAANTPRRRELMQRQLLMRRVKHKLLDLMSERNRARLLGTIRPWLYRGSQVQCPCCGGRFRRFLAHRGVPNVRCPKCGSMERHRLLRIYLDEHPEILGGACSVLHLAPEPPLMPVLRDRPGVHYTSADLASPLADVHCDIQALPFDDGSFDLVVCNHVLEHIPDDRKAMDELVRVARPGALAILMCPIARSRSETLEDPTVVTPARRLAVYGQEDHARLYGSDYVDRLQAAGFKVEIARFPVGASPDAIRMNRLERQHDLFEPDDVYLGRIA